MKFSAYNYPGQYLRHYNAELWLATPGGNAAYDADPSFDADTTWAIEAPWLRNLAKRVGVLPVHR